MGLTSHASTYHRFATTKNAQERLTEAAKRKPKITEAGQLDAARNCHELRAVWESCGS